MRQQPSISASITPVILKVFTQSVPFFNEAAFYMNAPEPRLDQSTTMTAISAFQEYLDLFPDAQLKKEATNRLFALQDLLVEKEYKNAKLYYDLGSYFGNCLGEGNNYQACIVRTECSQGLSLQQQA